MNKLKFNPYFIVKPENSSDGKGVIITNKTDEIPKTNKWVVQEYIHNPFLIEGYKFDIRLYVLITRVEPLSIFIYKEGIAIFEEQKYNISRFNIKSKTRLR